MSLEKNVGTAIENLVTTIWYEAINSEIAQ